MNQPLTKKRNIYGIVTESLVDHLAEKQAKGTQRLLLFLIGFHVDGAGKATLPVPYLVKAIKEPAIRIRSLSYQLAGIRDIESCRAFSTPEGEWIEYTLKLDQGR